MQQRRPDMRLVLPSPLLLGSRLAPLGISIVFFVAASWILNISSLIPTHVTDRVPAIYSKLSAPPSLR
ncbi:uncharacterized protein PHACADRAFT_253601 [Phanerochaete carnosa HHB-10118-sp]|uniref:Uncharacterized protein n=1 Tax=Phanerochaete carnosa (strain HHB-10118-sp) TaxID=650164 RepID=K5X131_PHACS|nr:uncharacterized protein PHACADRAFT_253601 [Phanerochaete carnosa HHB-10118-sp]EKM56462.1 hypothetical protein PHACADRAFT_253601 [Phanerochaete carnosa HHB-10118-sp]